MLTTPAGQTNAEGATISLQVTASDVDTAALTYTATGLPGGLSISSTTGLISGTISYAAAGSSPYTVTVGVSDGIAPQVSDTFSWTVTNVAGPTATISSSAPNPTNGSSIPAGVTFSQAVTGFQQSDLVVTNASVSGFAGSGASYTFTLTPTADGTVTVADPR